MLFLRIETSLLTTDCPLPASFIGQYRIASVYPLCMVDGSYPLPSALFLTLS